MLMKKLLWLVVLMILPAVVDARSFLVNKKTSKGTPVVETGKATGYYIWIDEQGLHLRWTAAAKPKLFTGRIDLDRPIKTLTRVGTQNGGWAKSHGPRIVLFSSTVRKNQLDGVDIVLTGGRRVQLALDIYGQPPEAAQVYLGEKGQNPRSIPILLSL